MDDHKKALESNERHMDELDPSRMSEEQIKLLNNVVIEEA